MPPAQLSDLIKSFTRDSMVLREQIAEICVHFEGGIDWNTAWGISFEDREIIIRVINKRIRAQNPNAPEYM